MIYQNTLNSSLKGLFISALLLLLTACSNENVIIKEIKDMYGQHIVFPQNYVVIYDNNTQDIKQKIENKKKIVVYIDYSLPCSDCYLDTFKNMEKELSEFTDDKDLFLIVMSNFPLDDDIREKCKNSSLNMSIIYYDSNDFSTINKLDDKHAKNKTFMVDKSNNIIAVGEFFNSPQLKQFYRKAIIQN